MVRALPVGPCSVGDEQDSESVVVEIAEAVGASLFDEQVDGSGATVGHAAGVEVGQDLLAPLTQGAPEAGDLGDRAGRE